MTTTRATYGGPTDTPRGVQIARCAMCRALELKAQRAPRD